MCGRIDRSGCGCVAIFETAEHFFDSVPLAEEDSVVADRRLAVCSAWNAGRDAALLESFAEPVGVLASVGEQFFCGGSAFNIKAAPL